MNKGVRVDLNEIIDAFEMIVATRGDFSRYFVNMHTGRILTLFEGDDFSDVEDEDLQDEWIPEHYVSLPQKDGKRFKACLF